MSQSVKAMKTTYLCLSGRDSQLLDELELEAVMAESALSVVLAHIRASSSFVRDSQAFCTNCLRTGGFAAKYITETCCKRHMVMISPRVCFADCMVKLGAKYSPGLCRVCAIDESQKMHIPLTLFIL